MTLSETPSPAGQTADTDKLRKIRVALTHCWRRAVVYLDGQDNRTRMINHLLTTPGLAASPLTPCFEKPFAEATLAEHWETQFALQYRCEALIRKFLKPPDDQFILLAENYQPYDVPQIHAAVGRCFPGWRLIHEAGSLGSKSLCLPVRKTMAVRPGRRANFLAEGLQCYQADDGHKRIISFQTLIKRRDTELVHLCLIGARHESRRITRQWSTLRRHIESGPHYLSGQAIRADGTVLDLERNLTWDDVVLAPEVKALLKRHTVDFVSKRALFQKNGIPQRRGIILHGPPGTGKTMIGKVLASQVQATFVLLGPADIDDTSDVQRIFTLGRRLRPVVLFFEDFDLYCGDRNRNRDPAVLAEFMAQLDGVEKNDGVLVVATTNDLSAIEPALVNRPSRFDVVIEIGLPDAHNRRQLFRHVLRSAVVDADAIECAACLSDGASGAQVREIATVGVQIAIEEGRVDETGRAMVQADDLAIGAERVLQRRRRPIGFGQALSATAS